MHNLPISGFDLETTGFSVTSDKIVQIAIITINPDGTENVFESLVNPGIPIPVAATKVHNITDDMVKNAPKFSEIAEHVYSLLSVGYVLGHNSDGYDIPLIITELEKCGIIWNIPKSMFIDTFKIESQLNSRKLGSLYKKYTGNDLENAHDAKSDVYAALEVFKYQNKLLVQANPNIQIGHIIDWSNDKKYPAMTNALVYDEHNEITINVGKYKGRWLSEIAKIDPSYINWMLTGDFHSTVKQVVRDIMNNKS